MWNEHVFISSTAIYSYTNKTVWSRLLNFTKINNIYTNIWKMIIYKPVQVPWLSNGILHH